MMTTLLYIFAGIGLLSVILAIFLIAGANILRRSGNETIPYYLHGLIGPEPRCDIGCTVADRRAAIHDATMGIPTTDRSTADFAPFNHIYSDRRISETPMDKGKPELERSSEPEREGPSGGVFGFPNAATIQDQIQHNLKSGLGRQRDAARSLDNRINKFRGKSDAERAERRAKAYSVGLDPADESQAYSGRTVVSISKARVGGGVDKPDDEGNKG